MAEEAVVEMFALCCICFCICSNNSLFSAVDKIYRYRFGHHAVDVRYTLLIMFVLCCVEFVCRCVPFLFSPSHES